VTIETDYCIGFRKLEWYN